MPSSKRWMPRFAALITVALMLVLVPGPHPTAAFTQQGFNAGFGAGIPMGHEWVTRFAAIELLGYSTPTPPDVKDPQDPRSGWTMGRARNLSLDTPGAQAEARRIREQKFEDQPYASRYKAVHDVIIGQRWVDLAGYNALTSKECWDSVAQEASEVQYDHFMRRWNDAEAQGGVTTANSSRERFVNYFVAAAMAPPTVMTVYDGGALGSEAVDVDRNYFLLGRATHMFQDSFSTEHTVRIDADNYVRVRQVKSFMCATETEQHSQDKMAVVLFKSGDVVWKEGTRFQAGWVGYKASNMKTVALVATEATKDLWAAFIRTMGVPMGDRERAARSEAMTLVNNWMSFQETELRDWYRDPSHRDKTFVRPVKEDPEGVDVKRCMATIGHPGVAPADRAKELVASQRKCLYNAIPWVGYSDLYDTQMRIWYSWRWRDITRLIEPPDDWKIPTLPADSGIRVRIRSAENGNFMSAPDGVQNNAWVYCRPGGTPLTFILVGKREDGAYRVASAPRLFLSYRTIDGAVKLFDSGALEPTNYKTAPAPGGTFTIMRHFLPMYMWLSGDSPWISPGGKPENRNAWWTIEGL
jgi:hypothetical protein